MISKIHSILWVSALLVLTNTRLFYIVAVQLLHSILQNKV